MDLESAGSKVAALRKKFIVADADFAHEQLASLVERASAYCVMDEQGSVHLRKKKLPQAKRLGLCLLARFIASRMDAKFSPTIGSDELSQFLGIGKPEVAARAKELVDNGFAERTGKGQYKMVAARIDDFLETLPPEQE